MFWPVTFPFFLSKCQEARVNSFHKMFFVLNELSDRSPLSLYAFIFALCTLSDHSQSSKIVLSSANQISVCFWTLQAAVVLISSFIWMPAQVPTHHHFLSGLAISNKLAGTRSLSMYESWPLTQKWFQYEVVCESIFVESLHQCFSAFSGPWPCF